MGKTKMEWTEKKITLQQMIQEEIEQLIRENQIVKATNRKLNHQCHVLIQSVMEVLSDIYPRIQPFSLPFEPLSNLPSFIGYYVDPIRNAHHAIITKLEEVLEGEAEEDAISMINLIGEKIVYQKRIFNECLQENRKLFEQLVETRGTVEGLRNKMQEMEIERAVMQLELQKNKIEREGDLKIIEELEKVEVRWRSRFQVVRRELEQVKKGQNEQFMQDIWRANSDRR